MKAKVEVVGNPVRPDIRVLVLTGPIPIPRTATSVSSSPAAVRARGYCREAVPAAIAMLPEDTSYRLHVTQQTRPEAMDDARRVYANALVDVELAPFFRDIAGRLAKSHLVIGRAGASTVCELAVAGLPSVLVPLAIAMDDHQRFNAKLLVDAGAAEAILEKRLHPRAAGRRPEPDVERPGTNSESRLRRRPQRRQTGCRREIGRFGGEGGGVATTSDPQPKFGRSGIWPKRQRSTCSHSARASGAKASVRQQPKRAVVVLRSPHPMCG